MKRGAARLLNQGETGEARLPNYGEEWGQDYSQLLREEE
jgi:hypothetical protein